MKHGFADTPEGQVHYITEGEGDPLLLLHQSPRSSRMYVELIPLLAKQYRVIAMDMFGYGRSGRLPQTLPTDGVVFLAQNVVHVLDYFGLDKVHLFGLHTGAGISGEVGAGWSDRLASLCLFGFPLLISDDERNDYFSKRDRGWSFTPSASTAPDGSYLNRLWLRAYSEVLRLWLHTANAPSETLDPNPMQSPHEFMTPAHLEFLERWIMDVMETSKNLGLVVSDLFSYNFAPRLPLITVPTHHIEPDSPYENYFCRRGEMLKNLIPDCEIAVMPASDDNAAEFKAPELAAMILEWLKKHPM